MSIAKVAPKLNNLSNLLSGPTSKYCTNSNVLSSQESLMNIKLALKRPIKIVVNGPTVADCRGINNCLRYGVVNVYSNSRGGRSSTSTAFYIDGSGNFIEQVDEYYGEYKQDFYLAFSAKHDFNKIPLKTLKSGAPEKYVKILSDLRSSITELERGIDLLKDPNALYDSIAARSAYDNLVDFLNNSEKYDKEVEDVISKQGSILKTMVSVLKGGIDISTSALPFIGDARDLYELSTGKDLVTGDRLDSFDRLLSGMGVVFGSGAFYRKIASKIKARYLKVMVKKSRKGVPGLKYSGNGKWISNAGLEYFGTNKRSENRLRHVLKHTRPNPMRESHTVFRSEPKYVPLLIDRAWKKRKESVPGDPGTYIIDMKKKIGTKGETKIKIVIVPGTKRLVTAYPWGG